MAKRQPERVGERLRDLRRRFSATLGEGDVDKDFTAVTSDARRLVPLRRFFAGEVFWVEREGWSGCGGFYTNPTRPYHPGLVVRKTTLPHRPIEMVPGTSKSREHLDDGRDAHLFCPSEEPKWTLAGDERPDLQVYVLDYWRPVARPYITHHLGNLRFLDIRKLQDEMELVHGSAFQAGGRAR